MLHEGIFLITQMRVFKLFKYLNNAYDSLSDTRVENVTSDLKLPHFE